MRLNSGFTVTSTELTKLLMTTDQFEPRIAVREEKRQANEALGRSFCKTLAELITNADSSCKRKHDISQSTGLVDLMLKIPKGTHLDTAELKLQLQGRPPLRRLTVEVATSKGHGRKPREIAVIDEAQGMSAQGLRMALEDIGGDRKELSGGAVGRNLFGRGLSDVMRAHHDSMVQTFDGNELTIAKGEWPVGGRWTIKRKYVEKPRPRDFADTLLNPATAGTAVVFAADKRCRIPDPQYVSRRLANFYMLRLIAADPNLSLVLRQYRAAGVQIDPISYDFPVGQVIESFSRIFHIDGVESLPVDVLIVRSDRKLEGVSPDRDGRENGLLIVDELDAVYDLTFVDPDFERAEFLKHIFGVIRITGLRAVLERYLNSPDFPTSPLRVDREGFNREHEFSKALLAFLVEELRPCYERERKRVEEGEQGKFSSETQRRIEEALKNLNKFFQEITDLTGSGAGGNGNTPPVPQRPVSIIPGTTTLTINRPRKLLVLVREDMVADGAEIVATATEGLTVQPETATLSTNETARWTPHKEFLVVSVTVTGSVLGVKGTVTVLVEGISETLEAEVRVENVLEEPTIPLPDHMEFRPAVSMGKPGRRNNAVLYVNPLSIRPGQCIRFDIIKRTGGVVLLGADGTEGQHLSVRLDTELHKVAEQQVYRVNLPWRGTAWNQHATIQATARSVAGPARAETRVRIDEVNPNDSGFFKRVDYDELDGKKPSQFAAGVITVNTLDPLNRVVLGAGPSKEAAKKEFDRRLIVDAKAQQRLASILVDEACFRALQQLFDDNNLPLPPDREIAEIHEQIDRYKFESATSVYRALVR